MSAPPPAPAAAPPRSSAASAPLPPSPPQPAPPATARSTAPPPRRWRSCPGSCSCRRASPASGRAWGGRGCGTRQSSPSCCWRATSAPPPAPAAAPPRSSTAVALPPFAPLPAPPATARRTAPPPRRWRSCPGSRSCRRGSPGPGRAWAGRDWRGTCRSSPSWSRPRTASGPLPAPAAAPPCSTSLYANGDSNEQLRVGQTLQQAARQSSSSCCWPRATSAPPPAPAAAPPRATSPTRRDENLAERAAPHNEQLCNARHAGRRVISPFHTREYGKRFCGPACEKRLKWPRALKYLTDINGSWRRGQAGFTVRHEGPTPALEVTYRRPKTVALSERGASA
eukprot:scaffold17331_cov66-Phaeocystis_antarctica.AAC.4